MKHKKSRIYPAFFVKSEQVRAVTCSTLQRAYEVSFQEIKAGLPGQWQP
jgi:hypothetical protein